MTSPASRRTATPRGAVRSRRSTKPKWRTPGSQPNLCASKRNGGVPRRVSPTRRRGRQRITAFISGGSPGSGTSGAAPLWERHRIRVAGSTIADPFLGWQNRKEWTHAHFQFALGKAELQFASARALAFQVLSSIWTEARAGRVPPRPMQAEARAAAAYITELAQRVTTVAFQSAGGGALAN
jgi:Acyl-CoA dehydrogenase, C-terminal domain